MTLTKLYHTVEDRGNPDEIEATSPFICKRKDVWLGEGYYFWDTFIENAHWWGKTIYSSKGYVVVEHSCAFSSDKCFDLLGNMEHLKEFTAAVEFLEKRELLRKQSSTVAQIIEFLKKSTDFEKKYEAIRAYGQKSKSSTELRIVPFVLGKNQYLDCTPAVQLCLFRKNSLKLSSGKIIYPTHYIEGYTI